MMQNDDEDENRDDNSGGDLQQYFSNGESEMQKPTWHQEEDTALSLEDLVVSKKADSQEEEDTRVSPRFRELSPERFHDSEESPEKSSPTRESLSPLKDGLTIIQTSLSVEAQPEQPDYHSQFFWKVNISEDLDDLLKDYE